MAPAVKGPQPLSGSYLIHTSSSLISSLLFMGAGPNVGQGMDYLIRERHEHPPGSFCNNACVLSLLSSRDTNKVCVLSLMLLVGWTMLSDSVMLGGSLGTFSTAFCFGA